MDRTMPKASFSNANRHMQEEEVLRLTSVGVDIGSSTSHLVFSRLELTLEGSRYRVTKRDVLNESEILLTPYVDDTRIDVEALGAFINRQYKNANIRREDDGLRHLDAGPGLDVHALAVVLDVNLEPAVQLALREHAVTLEE